MIYNFEDLKEIVKSKVSIKRFNHIMAVVDMSIKLAKIYNADIEKCKIAALLHDICKEMNMEEMKKICKNNFSEDLSDEDLENDEILHPFVGAYWVEKNLKIEDIEILNAIKNHTLGNKNMTLVEKIVYIADAVEITRNYPGVEEIRNLVFKDLNEGILFEAGKKEKYLESIGKKSHKNSYAMQKSIREEIKKKN
ncbi:bis(5'-nucleosyl)-tetraphosphatase (symmetrical) YqeK [Fusobacterium gastrosuis]|uniref:bis(5'-nucleosyl)-tetraphosphatase (symmetrical) YqeK n=2 Tax=Fusobacterium gastrosuis TaxID=1755100 RepID=UPI00297B72E7|nr:bis(5'-nucleosyl)-tetraphosphatase (symmetrical) YqeK [Fusobacteriaceae bacterium]MDD7410206.1 bis(5'-nucleosyl)-tetraphosphatase (symmetrical) YqeK [Fusobacteriaceae bacterium]MDY5712590.1 bis(5'-nucleosyl)-tetraphosphatase (symmetrical) YqeK [Fusobacterium gastrosuis]MDY5795576.1 bis(5'-nucleosyl)-tetraphosphatase (symmetrical) YqeK [Fusobacterium gastrosuis]